MNAFPRHNFIRKSLLRVLTLVAVTVVMLHDNTSNKAASGSTLYLKYLSSEISASREYTDAASSPLQKTKSDDSGEEGERWGKSIRRSTSSCDTTEMMRNGTDSRPNVSKIGAKSVHRKNIALPNILLIGAQKAGTSAVGLYSEAC